ncbi:unnamed protein product [Bemisia tabaci]|uniref:phosphoinositide 5-phosphatase n=1 Tax=Bemisia tabaci TaxID=7038 RepID=A0A9P0EZY3_BEMTA|nr:unnamed protein product [Bemisia tabaci]
MSDNCASPRSKKKQLSKLCSLLIAKKKRVGCAHSSSSETAMESSKSVPSDNSSPSSPSFKSKETPSEVPEKLETSTNVSLCCAMTEPNRTSLSLKAKINGEKDKSVYHKAVDQYEIRSKNVIKVHHHRSLSLGKSDSKLTSNDSIKINKSLESPELSPVSPSHSVDQPSIQRKLLGSKSSIENIFPSNSSTDLRQSCDWNCQKKRDKKKLGKSRPSSIAVIGRDAENSDTKSNASTESLVKKTLIAAHVLNLVPAVKVKGRNYLHGRVSINSLLGPVELDKALLNREIKIYIGTWNMNGQAPPSELNEMFLPDFITYLPDIVVVGTQESYPERFEWEVGVQETIGPSHVLLHSTALGTLHLAVYIRRELIWFVSVPEDSSISVRPGTAFRTKGAVAICFSLFGTSLLFVTSHLTAHAEKVKERIQDVKRIVKSLELPKNLPCRHKNKDVTQNFDYIFWCGDLNFRLLQSRDNVMQWIQEQNFPLTSPSKSPLADQLTNNIIDGTIFQGFEEGPITFPPTYKYDPGTQNFDTSAKQRTPSYTDRILFKSRKMTGSLHSFSNGPMLTEKIECLAYYSVPSICTSDHKPVWGLYKCLIRPGIDTIPLAAGLFNRDVYLEAVKRRATAISKCDGSSTVCSIQ